MKIKVRKHALTVVRKYGVHVTGRIDDNGYTLTLLWGLRRWVIWREKPGDVPAEQPKLRVVS